MKIRKLILSMVVLALAFVYQPVHADDSADFDQFMKEEFVQMMESDYTSLHFALIDYEKYGIQKPQPTIGEIPTLDNTKDIEDVEKSIEGLKKFNYDALTEEQQHDYDTYMYYLESNRKLLDYPMFNFYFLPNSGIQSNLITNFTEFVFYRREDIDDYLSVLESVPAFIDGAIEVTRTQASQGYFMTDSALESTLEGIEKFVEKKDENPLIQIFNQNIDKFDGLSDQERADYKERNRDLVLNSYIPEYEKLADELQSFYGSRTATSLYDMPDGKEYYQALLRYKSSSSATLQELYDLTNAQLKKLVDEYTTLYLKSDESKLEETLEEKDPTEVLTSLQNQLQEFPEGPKVSFTANYLDPSVANDGIVAYYMQPPIDDIEDNIIKINGDNVNSTNEMFTTLAHEGFPGHLFQITWYLNTNPTLLRTQLSNIGYTEGWAMYAEDVSWAYSDLNDEAKEMNRINTNLNYILPAQADFLVNGMGWDEKKLGDYYQSLGLNPSIASQMIDTVTQEPATIVPYGIGLAYYLDFRDQAQAAYGDKFNVVDFNRVLLTYGDRPFDIVQNDLTNYIGSNSASTSSVTSNPGLIGLAGAVGAAVVIVLFILLTRKKK
ncbi:MAG: DUF885 domain-containing protein [Erysipelotrichaceae bacterium]|nr:DUF885 domain-containing protein [Erysipelotrichaceae bacterium]MDY6035224.1 DUF885 domain-containing protein [Bulleidia sp.]